MITTHSSQATCAVCGKTTYFRALTSLHPVGGTRALFFMSHHQNAASSGASAELQALDNFLDRVDDERGRMELTEENSALEFGRILSIDLLPNIESTCQGFVSVRPYILIRVSGLEKELVFDSEPIAGLNLNDLIESLRPELDAHARALKEKFDRGDF